MIFDLGYQGDPALPSIACAMLAAIWEFACREKPRHLILIRLVILDQVMFSRFEDAVKQEEGRSFKKKSGLLAKGIGITLASF